MTEFSSTDDIVEKYADLIAPHLDLAKRAYGAKTQVTPAASTPVFLLSLMRMVAV